MARKSRKAQTAVTHSKIYKTAIYARLSRENPENEKIENQIMTVKQYIKTRPEFNLVDIYSDNGFSGTNFDRPEFQRLMEDLRNRKIDCIIVKDLSRFAREHIGAEDYLNNIFPFLGVRFIAINDNYDNLNIKPQEYFIASFKNLAHDYFARETSRKVSSTKRKLQEQGKFIGSRISYGYKRDPDDKHKLLIDDEKANVVREIFQRVAKGDSIVDICINLNDKEKSSYVWKPERIYVILKKEIYTGTLVQRQTITSLYKNEEVRRLPRDEQIRSENAVPAIISRELWEKAHFAISEREKEKHRDIPQNPYYGVVYCGKCGKKLPGGYRRDLSDFTFNCGHCKSGVFAKGIHLNNAVRKHLKLTQDVDITPNLIKEKIDKIFLFSSSNIVINRRENT